MSGWLVSSTSDCSSCGGHIDPAGLPLADGAPEDHPKVTELRALAQWAEGLVWCSSERHEPRFYATIFKGPQSSLLGTTKSGLRDSKNVLLTSQLSAPRGLETNMVQRAQIKCINKTPRSDPNESITHVGGVGTVPWKLPLADAIGKIERREWEFFVNTAGREVKVIVAISRANNKYLRTEADDSTTNNLLSLPECP